MVTDFNLVGTSYRDSIEASNQDRYACYGFGYNGFNKRKTERSPFFLNPGQAVQTEIHTGYATILQETEYIVISDEVSLTKVLKPTFGATATFPQFSYDLKAHFFNERNYTDTRISIYAIKTYCSSASEHFDTTPPS